jgi:hypothetical protein
MKEVEMGWACNAHGGDEKCAKMLWVDNPEDLYLVEMI